MLGGSVTACPPDGGSIVQTGLSGTLSGDCLRTMDWSDGSLWVGDAGKDALRRRQF